MLNVVEKTFDVNSEEGGNESFLSGCDGSTTWQEWLLGEKEGLEHIKFA